MTHVRTWELANRRLSAGKHSIEHPLQLVALPKSRLRTVIPADVWVETSVKNHKFRVLRCFWLVVHLPLNSAALHWETHKRNVFTCFQTMCQIHIIGTTPLKSPEPLIISTWSSVFWGPVQIHPIRSYWWSTTGRIHFNESIPQWTSTCSSKINDTWGIADDYIYDYSMYLNFPWDIHPSSVTAYVCKWSPARWHVRRLRGCRRRRRRSSNNLNIQKETNMQRKQTILWWWKQEQMMITKLFRKAKPIKTPYHWTIWRLYSYNRTVVFHCFPRYP